MQRRVKEDVCHKGNESLGMGSVGMEKEPAMEDGMISSNDVHHNRKVYEGGTYESPSKMI